MQMVRLLHSLGADTAAADQYGTGPIHIAALFGHVEVVNFLHEQGADMEARGTVYLDNQYEGALVKVTALYIAVRRGHNEIIRLLRRCRCARRRCARREASALTAVDARARLTSRSGSPSQANPTSAGSGPSRMARPKQVRPLRRKGRRFRSTTRRLCLEPRKRG